MDTPLSARFGVDAQDESIPSQISHLHLRRGAENAGQAGVHRGDVVVEGTVSDINGCNEIVEHEVNGLLVPPKSTQKLADAMLQTLEISSDRSDSIERGRYFSAERAVDAYLQLFGC